jgi:hypothetical protein
MKATGRLLIRLYDSITKSISGHFRFLATSAIQTANNRQTISSFAGDFVLTTERPDLYVLHDFIVEERNNLSKKRS